MLMCKATFKERYLRESGPTTILSLWRMVKRAAKLSSGRTPCSFRTETVNATGDYVFHLEYSTDANVIERRRQKRGHVRMCATCGHPDGYCGQC